MGCQRWQLILLHFDRNSRRKRGHFQAKRWANGQKKRTGEPTISWRMLANRGEREAQMSNQLARHGAASIGLEINALDGSQ